MEVPVSVATKLAIEYFYQASGKKKLGQKRQSSAEDRQRLSNTL